MDLQAQLGNIDVYLFDQLLRGRLRPGMRVLDAACGGGRNLIHLLREGFDVWAVDEDPAAIDHVRSLAAKLAPRLPAEQFVAAPVEAMPFDDASFDYVICNALLHFARDEAHFDAMVAQCARALRPGGTFFARLMSTVGVESLVQRIHGQRHRLPTGQEVFLVDDEMLRRVTRDIFHGTLADPLKSTVVHGQRTMTTWVVRRGEG